MFGFNPAAHGQAPLDRALDAAKRSVQLAPDCVMGQYGLAQTYFYRREFELFRAAATRALALAPYRTDMQASLGLHFAYDGQWKKGLQMIDLARKLNPLHPGWYWFPFVADAYRRKDLFVAMIEGKLGHRDKASAALRRAVELNPALTNSAREIIGKIFPDETLVDRFVEGLAKAGLGD
jgi:tetratricopeptide (TPR) repeat protein